MTACKMRQGSAVRIAMPSVLWSPSASFRGLRRFACVIASLTQQRQLAFEQLRRENIAQLQQCVALLLCFDPDLVADCAPLRRRSRSHLRVDLGCLAGLPPGFGEQARTRAERVRDRRLD